MSKISKVNPFDVTLRDGLQSLNPDEKIYFTTNKKKELYDNLIYKYNPTNLEIGSMVNNKVLPIFEDTEEIFRYAEFNNTRRNNYILVPNEEQLLKSLNFGVTNFSFITSVSNSFQIKNTKMTIEENLTNLNNMMYILDDYSNFRVSQLTGDIYETHIPFKIKLYVSCINECPIEGKIPTNVIINELQSLKSLRFDKICLSDTCGSLTKEDFIDIITQIKNVGLDITNFSLHLHVRPERENEAENIFHIAVEHGINEFDVSELSSGGCSVTMDKKNIAPNMSYEQYYRFLTNYLLS